MIYAKVLLTGLLELCIIVVKCVEMLVIRRFEPKKQT